MFTRSVRSLLIFGLTAVGFFAAGALDATPAVAGSQWLTNHPRLALIPRRSSPPPSGGRSITRENDQTSPAGYNTFTNSQKPGGDNPNSVAPAESEGIRPSGRLISPPRN